MTAGAIAAMRDEELVEKVVDGQHEAFDELYGRYVSRIFRFLAPRMPESQAEDLTAAIMATIWKNLSSFAHRCAFSTWVYTVANNSLKNWYRKNRPSYSLSLMERLRLVSVFPGSESDDDLEDLMATKLDFNRAFKRLPENYQTVLLLRVVERLPADEVAHVMGLRSPNAVACLLYRAKELFRRLYNDPCLQVRVDVNTMQSPAGMTVVKHDVKA